MKVGSIDVHIVSDGQVRLDGGGLFGVVPRPLWRNLAVADRMNRVAMGLNCLLVRTGGKNVLVDTGVGAKHPPRRRALFAMTAGRLLRRLKGARFGGVGHRPRGIDSPALRPCRRLHQVSPGQAGAPPSPRPGTSSNSATGPRRPTPTIVPSQHI